MSDFYTMTMLNATGDVTVAWDADNEKEIKEMISSKLEQGFVFFILEERPAFLTIFGKKKVYINDIKDLKDKKEVILKTKDCASKILNENYHLEDKEIEQLFKIGKIAIGRVPSSNYQTVGRAKTVDQVVKNHTIATRKLVGG